jgi:signal transduction histidine kinase
MSDLTDSKRVDGRLVAGVLVTVGAVGLAVVLIGPGRILGSRRLEWHLVLETVNACVALLLAYLVYGRFLRSSRWQDLLLLQGLVLLGTANVLLALSLIEGDASGVLDLWLPPSLRVLGTLLIGAAALTPGPLVGRAGWRRWALAPVGGVVVLLAVLLHQLRERLPRTGDSDRALPSATDGHPALLVAQLLTMTCFAVAAVAFVIQARNQDDVLLRWLGPACALGALARLNYLVFPSREADWLYSGDILRTGCYLLLLVGAGREISRYWQSQAELAVAENRRRLAREMHDGVLQELGYIRAEVAKFRGADAQRVDRILGASERALDEARQLVDTLGRSGNETLGIALHRAVEEVAERYSVALELDLDDSVTVDRDQRHALVRIAREAVLNGVRHGRAQRIKVALGRDEEGCLLTVRDDGAGFDPVRRTQQRAGFGLISMRERAEALPGTLELTSAPGEGTTVVVRW